MLAPRNAPPYVREVRAPEIAAAPTAAPSSTARTRRSGRRERTRGIRDAAASAKKHTSRGGHDSTIDSSENSRAASDAVVKKIEQDPRKQLKVDLVTQLEERAQKKRVGLLPCEENPSARAAEEEAEDAFYQTGRPRRAEASARKREDWQRFSEDWQRFSGGGGRGGKVARLTAKLADRSGLVADGPEGFGDSRGLGAQQRYYQHLNSIEVYAKRLRESNAGETPGPNCRLRFSGPWDH